MISRLGLAISRIFRATAPDPFVIAIALTLFTALLAVLCGTAYHDLAVSDRLIAILDVWRFNDAVPAGDRLGIWKLLEFTMQMCLVLVTGSALACAPPIRVLIRSAASLPKSTASAAAMIGFVACACALVNWGLGLIVGAHLAREVGRSMKSRGIPCHYPLLCAAGYTGLMVWHGGLSGSAPLSMTTAAGAAKVLPAEYAQQLGEQGVPLSHTLFSPMNIVISLGLLVLTPVLLAMLAPRKTEQVQLPPDDLDLFQTSTSESARTLPDRLDRSPIVVWILAIALALGLTRFARSSGWERIGLNEVNAAMLALGLVMHGSPIQYMRAAEEGARGCAGIIIQFPLYAGIMAMMQGSGLVQSIAQSMTQHSSAHSLPVLTFLSAGVINLFIPSGGGQWAVQGPLALTSGLQLGVEPGKMIMSVAYGDQLTNMLQPFWALPLLAITGVKARDIVGYTAVVMVVCGAWIALGLWMF
ncbi:MAG TPA: TIGR00366 family protein [Phycisphaerales bacterium]|nr:TIGR00366 family protein [Phycisphaerales bacterium]